MSRVEKINENFQSNLQILAMSAKDIVEAFDFTDGELLSHRQEGHQE
jgi:hypothetical protein